MSSEGIDALSGQPGEEDAFVLALVGLVRCLSSFDAHVERMLEESAPTPEPEAAPAAAGAFVDALLGALALRASLGDALGPALEAPSPPGAGVEAAARWNRGLLR